MGDIAKAVGLVSLGYAEDESITFRLIPMELVIANHITGESQNLECYPNRFILNGELATDTEVVTFLKELARGWATKLFSEQPR